MENNTPRVVIAGTQSGSGKTTITCAILQMLVNNGLKAASFKCGPDYIDPMFHSKAIGAKSQNLDGFFCDDNTINYLLKENSKKCRISVIEGVMGFYDGLNLNSTKASAYDIAKITASPVILTVNCKGMANSALAIVKGFKDFKPDSNIKGVILNNIAKTTFEALKKQIEYYFNGEISVVGYLPKLEEKLTFKSRHLGLITADEIADIKENLQILADIAKDTIDINKIIQIANSAPQIQCKDIEISKMEKVKIAVSYDAASCFYYSDNLSLLKKIGAELVYFSPMESKELPNDIQGLYIGGGYPELYLDKLSQNKTMINSIKTAIERGIPFIAECGGFMYLTSAIEGVPMVNAFNASCHNTKKLCRFGYITMTAKEDNLLCRKEEKIKAHQFHYYDSSDIGSDFLLEKANGKSWQEVFSSPNYYAGFPHIHFWQNINIAVNFYKKCIERK